jgi:hypothetical protein
MPYLKPSPIGKHHNLKLLTLHLQPSACLAP